MPKRGENIYKRQDGRWEGRYIAQRQTNGKAIYRSVYGKTYSEVKQKLTEKQQEVKKKTTIKEQDITIEHLMELWLEHHKGEQKESTTERYRFLIDKHIIPQLGTISLSDVTTDMLNDFVKQKLKHGRLDQEGGLSQKTVTDILILLKSALKFARHKSYYHKVELDYVQIPSVKQKKIEVFTSSELKKITKYALAFPDITNVCILLGLETGLRIGEICALRWSDIDFEEKVLHVERTAIRIKQKNQTKLVIQTPKSENSEREVPLTPKLLELLTPFYTQESYYILSQSDKQALDPRTLQYRFHRFLKQLGIRKRGFHAIRHSFATRCAESGMDIKSLSEVLGHSNVRTTLQMYVHPSMDSKRKGIVAASTLENGKDDT